MSTNCGIDQFFTIFWVDGGNEASFADDDAILLLVVVQMGLEKKEQDLIRTYKMELMWLFLLKSNLREAIETLLCKICCKFKK